MENWEIDILDEPQEQKDQAARSGAERLAELLSERNQYPDRAAAIDAKVHAAFGRRVSLLALDMCGFSELTDRYGIIHFLAMIQQMTEASEPAIRGNGGHVIKRDADNLFAIFDHPVNALEAALDIFRAFEAMNAVLPNERDIYGSIGIGYGDSLIIGEEDLFGAEVNLASKLGEDCATRMQILLTPDAKAALPAGRYVFGTETHRIGGADVECFSFEKSLFPR